MCLDLYMRKQALIVFFFVTAWACLRFQEVSQEIMSLYSLKVERLSSMIQEVIPFRELKGTCTWAPDYAGDTSFEPRVRLLISCPRSFCVSLESQHPALRFGTTHRPAAPSCILLFSVSILRMQLCFVVAFCPRYVYPVRVA